MNEYNPEVLISEEEIQIRLNDLAMAINKDYAGEELTVICVLKGAFMFCSDLIKLIDLPIKLEFMDLSSYGDAMTSSGEVKINLDIESTIKGRNVLVVEDIIDSGLTLNSLMKTLMFRKPKDISVATLLFKPARASLDYKIDYLGFEVDDKFVVGYGLDYAGRYRELPYIGTLNAGN